MRLSNRSNTTQENRSPLEVTEAQILGRTCSNSSRFGYPRHIPVPQATLKAHERVVPFHSVRADEQKLVSFNEQTLSERIKHQKAMDVADEPAQTYSHCKWEPLPARVTKKPNSCLLIEA